MNIIKASVLRISRLYELSIAGGIAGGTANDQPNMGHLSVEDLEGIKQKLYGGQKLLANTPAEGEPEQ